MTKGMWAFIAVAGLGCTPERNRPGPPDITIQVPVGSTVFSPDTLHVRVVAQDPNGLDSLTVTFLDSTVSINTQFETQAEPNVAFPVPPNLADNTTLTVFARATDLTGQATSQSATVTVIPRPPNQRARLE